MRTNRGGFPLPSGGLGGLLPTFRDKFFGTLFTGMATAVLTVAATTLTPIGDGLHERVSPTSATVTGNLLFGGVPIAGADVVLDGERHETTRSLGEFTFTDVAKGIHHIRYVRDQQTLYEFEIPVAKRQTSALLGPTDITRASPMLVAPNAVATAPPTQVAAATQTAPANRTAAPAPTPPPATVVAELTRVPTFPIIFPQLPEFTIDLPSLALFTPTPAAVASGTPEAGVGEPAQELTLSVGSADQTGVGRVTQVVLVGEPDVVADVDHVTYALPDGYNPSVVSRFSSADGFAVTFVPDAGAAVPVRATVYLKDGTSVELTTTVAPA